MTKPKMKLVRINDKTQIEVKASIPDEVAKARWLERLNEKLPIMGGYMKGYKSDRKNVVKDIPRNDIVFDKDNTGRDIRKFNVSK